MTLLRATVLALATLLPLSATAQDGPLRIEITEGVIEPLPIAVNPFIAEAPEARQFAQDLTQIIGQDLSGTGLFREIPPSAYISQITSFDAPVQYADWKAINAQGLVTGAVGLTGDGRITVKFRLFDVFSEAPLGEGLVFTGSTAEWRRMAHKVADQIYGRITGEGPYFDSRVGLCRGNRPEERSAEADRDHGL